MHWTGSGPYDSETEPVIAMPTTGASSTRLRSGNLRPVP